jgi:hypothetical protein
VPPGVTVSAIATFISLPKSSLGELREVAQPKKRLFGRPRDDFYNFLAAKGTEVVKYNGSGYVVAIALPFLKKKLDVDLVRSEHDGLAQFLSKLRGASMFIFSVEQKNKFLPILQTEPSESEARDYYNEFNSTDDSESGAAMLEAIRAIRRALTATDEDSVVLGSIA